MKIVAPLFIKMEAGVGTESTEVHLWEIDTDKPLWEQDPEGCLWDMAIDHGHSYGVEQDEDGEWEYDEPSCYIAGIYNPEKHDMYRCGGGSFLDERGVKECLEAFLASGVEVKE